MTKTISIHSFRGGTGKSNISANLSYLLAKKGKKVCVVDTDIQSPGIHVLLQEEQTASTPTLNDCLWNQKPIAEIPIDVSSRFDLTEGKLFLIPANLDMAAITRVLKEGYDAAALTGCFKHIGKELDLDYLIIDTHPGLNEETLLSIAVSDYLTLIMRPDQQDFQGTSITVEVAKRLKVENIMIIANRMLPNHDLDQVRSKIEEEFACPVAGMLPSCDELADLGSRDLFCRCQPENKWSTTLAEIAEKFN